MSEMMNQFDPSPNVKELYEHIREEYPNPTAKGEGFYCVLGALSAYDTKVRKHGALVPNPYPSVDVGAEMLQRVVPGMGADEACQLAHAVIVYNDGGNFEQAWGVLRGALRGVRIRVQEENYALNVLNPDDFFEATKPEEPDESLVELIEEEETPEEVAALCV